MARRAFVVLQVATAALLAGCLGVRTPERGGPVRLEPGEGAVFGRVRLFDRGREFDPWKLDLQEILAEDPVVKLALFHVESEDKRPDVPIGRKGRFEWILPAGTYLLYHTPSVTPPFNEPLAAFQVSASAEPVDLGELLVDVSVDRRPSAETATYSILAVDARAGTPDSAGAFARRHPGSEPVRIGRLVTDPELGGLFTNWSRDACARLLARHGLELGPKP